MSRSPRKVVMASGVVACACLAVGSLAATNVKSPAQAAAEARPPAPSAITAPVERRTLTSQLVTRGDAAFAGALEVRLETGGSTLPPVVTGRVPEPGTVVTEGMVLLEVAGRPVIVLGGDLPTYRSLRPGLSGPDVHQLERALERLGHRPGPVDGSYDRATAAAVSALFRRAGYEPPEMDEDDEARLRTARQTVREARNAVAGAERALADAAAGASAAERLAGKAEVDAASRAVDAARAGGDHAAVAAALDQLAIAQARYDELVSPADTAAEKERLDTAREDLAAAETELADAEASAGTPLPAAEVVFLPGLPRRVDEVKVSTGALVDEPVMTVSAADLVVNAAVTRVQRGLLREGMPGRLQLGGHEIDATVTAIRPRSSSGDEDGGNGAGTGEFDVVLTPEGLTPEQVAFLRGANVRVVIPITGTDGPVLAVPAAAISAGPDGRSRIEIDRPAGPEIVDVEVGLTADGYVEIRAAEGTVVEGDRVVIGR